LLSQLDDKELKLVMKNVSIGQVTEHSVTDKKVLMAQIKEIRRQGYSISHGERIAGAMCISAPVDNYFWPVALSVVGPESRLGPRVDGAVEKITTSARHISENVKVFSQAKGVMDIEQI
jgi:IclR family acetate operon transcriptional repressor